MADSDHYFQTCCPYPSVPTFQNLAKDNNFQVKIVITTGKTVGLAEWIVDDTCIINITRIIAEAII